MEPRTSSKQRRARLASRIAADRDDPADPFGEKFDEEEVVLDNFAAWDDMFPADTPRVENRRDPSLATLVQAAIDAPPAT